MKADAVKMPVSFGDLEALIQPASGEAITYGEAPTQSVLRYEVGPSTRPMIMLVHGGCWSAEYSRDYLLPMATALQDRGFEVWLPEYRRVGDEGGGWPGSLADILAAVDLATSLSDRSLLLMGHSAGGHLALLAQSERQKALGARLIGNVALAGITDLWRYGAGDNSCQQMVVPFLGGDGSLSRTDYDVASPQVRSYTHPVILMRGEVDSIVGPDQMELAGASRSIVPDAGHFDLVHPETPAFAAVLDAIETLVSASQ
ncbi:putative lipase/esterase [Luminiphilus syltensis NOR5-1B]|uniref:Putative lipase/esterase n=1 Tax=Luminiphilus syltensis NOR5-1B TaxID=565045 RepID=B8KWP0_9GAMM|nr:putative lipase/esterase [Luminiphilus syltensis NOR5-1B]